MYVRAISPSSSHVACSNIKTTALPSPLLVEITFLHEHFLQGLYKMSSSSLICNEVNLTRLYSLPEGMTFILFSLLLIKLHYVSYFVL